MAQRFREGEEATPDFRCSAQSGTGDAIIDRIPQATGLAVFVLAVTPRCSEPIGLFYTATSWNYFQGPNSG